MPDRHEDSKIFEILRWIIARIRMIERDLGIKSPRHHKRRRHHHRRELKFQSTKVTPSQTIDR